MGRSQEIRGERRRGRLQEGADWRRTLPFVSFNPGVELVPEAFEGFWRKTPTVRKLVFRVIPDETTRLAALKRGEVDIAYSIREQLADEVRRTPGLTQGRCAKRRTMDLFPRSVGPEIALARCPVHRAADVAIKSGCDQSGPDARSFPHHGQHCAEELQVFSGNRRKSRTIHPMRAHCWPRPDSVAASTQGSITATHLTPIWLRPR